MKKKLLIVLSLMLFINLITTPLNTQAATGKVMNKAAKEVAKQIVADQAVQMSMNLVLDPKYRYKKSPDEPQSKQGYTMICYPRDKKGDGTCSAPVQVKSEITAQDKKQIKAKAITNLEQNILGGVGATKFGKFVDWFVPTFAVGVGATVVSAALSGELGNFFDNLAFDSLADLGMMGTVEDDRINTDPVRGVFIQDRNGKGSQLVARYSGDRDAYMTYKGVEQSIGKSGTIGYSDAYGGRWAYHIWGESVWYGSTQGEYKLNEDGSNADNPTLAKSNLYILINSMYFKTPTGKHEPLKPSNQTSLPKFNETAMTPTISTSEPQTIVGPGAIPFTKTDTGEVLIPYLKPDGSIGFKTSKGEVVPDENITVGEPFIKENEDGSKTVMPAPKPDKDGMPSTYPNGQPVKNPDGTPTPKPNPDGTPATNPDGTPVTNPDGSPVPQPDPNAGGNIPPPVKPNEEEDPENPKPEAPENACNETIKPPPLSALFRTLSTSFPFSLPFDVYRAFNALFADIGSEKPKVKFQFWEGPEITITIPDVLDDMVPYVRSFLLFTFDVGLLYGIYRLIRV